MDRIKLSDMEKWYDSPHRKPLIIWGARQVGKTYLVKELFAKKFMDYAYIDLNKDDDAREFFDTTSDADKYLRYIEYKYGKKIAPDVPLIFDEAQMCPRVISSLKYFCQDHRELPVIATGSMVRLAIRHGNLKGNPEDFLFPVGKIDEMDLYPITFEEYLMNTNIPLLNRIREAYAEMAPLEDFEHRIAMDALYEYLSVGGLPEVLDVFLKERSYADAGRMTASVYRNYLSDMDSYNISSETILKTKNLYGSIFSQLDKPNKNFKITQVEKGKSNRDYFNAYQWLELARVVYRSINKTGKVVPPLTADGSGLFRLYLSDAGLFAYQSGTKKPDFFTKNKQNAFSGIFYENYVADELKAKGIDLYYWTGKNMHEFEFLVQSGSDIIPIDVKKNKGKMNSLEAFRSCNPKSLAVKISSNNYGYDEEKRILTIPLYETFMLAEDIANGNCIVGGTR